MSVLGIEFSHQTHDTDRLVLRRREFSLAGGLNIDAYRPPRTTIDCEKPRDRGDDKVVLASTERCSLWRELSDNVIVLPIDSDQLAKRIFIREKSLCHLIADQTNRASQRYILATQISPVVDFIL